MATHSSSLAESPLFGAALIQPPNPAAASSGYVVEGSISGTLTDNSPGLPGQDTLPAACGEAPWSRIVERIIIVARVIDAGLVLTDVQKSGLIWNNFQADDATLDALVVTGGTGIQQSGISVSGTLQRTRSVIVLYDVSSDGPLTIDAAFDYQFDLQSAIQYIVGFRGIAFIKEPLLRGYSESYEWVTDVFESEDGSENRCGLLDDDTPNRSIGMVVKAFSDRDVAEIQNALTFGGAVLLFVPQWLSESKLTAATDGISAIVSCPTADREFIVDSSVILLKNPLRNKGSRLFSVRKVLAINPTSLELDEAPPAGFEVGDSVIPLLQVTQARTTEYQGTIRPRAAVRIEFTEIREGLSSNPPPALGLPTYRGFDVFSLLPRFALEQTFANDFTIRGKLYQKQLKHSVKKTERLLEFTVEFNDRSEKTDFVNFFNTVKGQLTTFWSQSYQADYVVASGATSGSAVIEVNTEFAVQELLTVKRHIYAPRTGQRLEVLAAAATSGDTVQLTVSPNLTADLIEGDELENLYLVRFASDTLKVEADGLSHDPVTTRARIAMEEVQPETPSS